MNLFNYLFERSRFSHRKFLLGNSEEISYEKLFQETLLLAHQIRERHGENNRIILVSPNSVFFITAYLAIIKSGNVCVPLHPSVEARNLEYITRQCDSTIAFVSGTTEDPGWRSFEHLYDHTSTYVPGVIDSSHYFLFQEEFDQERLAEIIFTSGSTGEPKGVMITHHNIIANTNSILQYLELTVSDIMEVVLPFYYCYGLSLLHTHIRAGASIVMNNSFMFLGTVIDDLVKYRCTGFAGVPSHFQVLLRKSTSFKSGSFPHLKYVTQAGGKLHKSFLHEFREHFPGIDFYVMYGQTEATARLTYLEPGKMAEKEGSIGKAIPGVELNLVDENDIPVTEPGQVGELVARGDNVMTGYLNDPETTARVLKNGWLHTSDLAWCDRDGYYYLTSRKEEIIKVGGERISPREIEEVIVSMPEVVDCSVSGVFDETQGESINAVIVPSKAGRDVLDETTVRAYCSKHLAAHKIPARIQFQAELDVADTGKKVKK